MAGVGEGPYVAHHFGQSVKDRLKESHGWLVGAVHQTISWPEEDVLVEYDGHEYFLLGLSAPDSDRRLEPNIAVPLFREADKNSTLHRVYVFASILGWYQRGYVDVVHTTSGSRPYRIGSMRQPFAGPRLLGRQGFNCNFLPLVRKEETRKALAFWREGLKLENVHSGYSFLSFYKVIESQFRKGRQRGEWIENALGSLTKEAAQRIQELRSSQVDIGNHLFESGRCAVAHATFGKTLIDPDIPEDRIRISKDLVIVKSLAEKYIREVHQVPDFIDVQNGRDALVELHEYIDPSQFEALRSGGSVLRKKFGLNGLRVSINHWPEPTLPDMRQLELNVVSAVVVATPSDSYRF